MSTTKAISGAVDKNNGGTILHAGNIAGTAFTNMTLATTLDPNLKYGSQVVNATGLGVAASGNLGTKRAFANNAGAFAEMETGKYVAKILGIRIAQQDDTFLRSGAAQTSSRRPLHYAKGNHRYHITDWSYTTGAATKGGSAGNLFTYVDPETGSAIASEPLPTNAVPGRLGYKEPKFTPVKDTYKPRTLG